MTLLTLRPTRAAPSATHDAELLFKEARRRRRRRRILMVLVVAAIAAAGAAAVVMTAGGEGRAASTPAISHPAVKAIGPPPQVAWVDYQGQVHIGSLPSHQQRVVANGTGSPTISMVASGGTLFWAAEGGVVYDKVTRQLRSLPRGVMAYDTVTGRVRSFASGGLVFNAVDSTDVFIGSGDTRHLARYSVDGRLREQFTLPDGWILADGYELGTSTPALSRGGILVQSQPAVQSGAVKTKPSKLAIWTPATGSIRVLGNLWAIATYTDTRDSHSLIAGLPAVCESSNSDCLLQITDTATGATRQIRSPLGYGFDFRGAFSPDGRQLAVFAKSNPGYYNPATRAALVDVATGSLRLVSGATIGIGESLAWAQWLPGSKELIVGGTSDDGGLPQANHFLVDSSTRQSTPFRFLTHGDVDVNYSVVVLP
jgi:hypothetical protein